MVDVLNKKSIDPIDLEKAIILYDALGGDFDAIEDPVREDHGYYSTMKALKSFRQSERPFSTLKIEGNAEMIATILIDFSNSWKSRIPSYKNGSKGEKIKTGYKNQLEKIIKYLDNLNKVTLATLSNSREHDADIKNCFDCLCNPTSNSNRPVPAAKMLHIIKPDLFVAWDNPIAKAVLNLKNPKLNGENYFIFLKSMQENEKSIPESTRNELYKNYFQPRLQPDKRFHPTEYYKKTSTKLLDEYNWITITNKTEWERFKLNIETFFQEKLQP